MTTTILMDRGGFSVPDEVATDAFYGFRLDPITGHLNVEVIAAGTDVIQLPQEGVIDPNDYVNWMWSPATLQFDFAPNGHLKMTVL